MSSVPHSSAPHSAPHPANMQLQALAFAHQQGQLDRAQYRARRRTLLEAARQAQGVTLRNALPSSPPGRQSLAPVAQRVRKLRGWAAAIVTSVILVALFLLIFHKGTSVFERRSARGDVEHTDRRAAASPANARAAAPVGRAQQWMVLGDVDGCV